MAETTIVYRGPIVSRADARKSGLNKYFTGNPCPVGHVSEFWMNSGCVACHYIRNAKWQETHRQVRSNENKNIRRSQYSDETARKRELREASRVAKAGRERPSSCELCGQKGVRIVFDHCHATGNFRGWLCDWCNKALGFAKDSPELLRKMAMYLEIDRGAVDGQTQEQSTDLGFCGTKSIFPARHQEPSA